MTKYTDYHSLPYPASAKEAGNGGLHSELLARGIARELDALDAGWAGEQQHASTLLSKNGDDSGIVNGSSKTIGPWTVDKQTSGVGLSVVAFGLSVLTNGGGWYHVVADLRSRADGAITAGAQHRLELVVFSPTVTGSLAQREIRYSNSFQLGVNDVYTGLEVMFRLDPGDQLRMQFFHLNTASTARVVGSGTGGTRLTATKIVS